MSTPRKRLNPSSNRPHPKSAPDDSRHVDRFWTVTAIVAIIAATAGWTTVAVTTFFDGHAPSDATSIATDAPADATTEPEAEAESHQATDLEALLPAEFEGTVLTAQSWTGDTLLADDDWSAAITSFLESEEKAAADFTVAQAWDATAALELVVGAFRVDGVNPTSVMEAMKAAWLANDDTFVTSEITLAGLPITKGTYDDEEVAYYWYATSGVVYDIETADEAVAAAVVERIKEAAPLPGASSGTPTPSRSTSASP